MKNKQYTYSLSGLTIDRVIRREEFSMTEKQLHQEYEIYYLVQGQRYYFIEDKLFFVHEGSLVLINKNQVHRTSSCGPGSHERIVLNLHPEFVQEAASCLSFSLESLFDQQYGVFTFSLQNQSHILFLLTQISDECKTLTEKSTPLLDTDYALLKLYVLELLLYAKEHKEKSSLSRGGLSMHSQVHQRVQETASYILTHYPQPISLASIADAHYIHKSYLARIFKEITGFTVLEYLTLKRIQEAKKLLVTTNLSIEKISLLCGFSSSTYFERIFKKSEQVTPLRYRKLYFQIEGK